jgi:hypothetical protein
MTKPKPYASQTEVPVEKSKRQIELLLQQHGAEAYHTGWDAMRDIIEFGWKGKQIRFVLRRFEKKEFEISERGYSRTQRQQQQAYEQADRARWRALYLVVRAKVEAVNAGIAVFEEEFMAFIVVPGRNQTVGEILLPRIEQGSFDVNRALSTGDAVEAER